MQIAKDALWKGIIENLVDDFLVFFFPAAADQLDFDRGVEFLDTELSKLRPDNAGKLRHADRLIKAWLKGGQECWFLVHVEVQGYPDPEFAHRMWQYAYRIRDRYPVPLTAMAIYTDADTRFQFRAYEESFFGTHLHYAFNTYILYEHPPHELARDPNPFAAVMEAAWQLLPQPKNDQNLLLAKIDLIKRLHQRNIQREKIRLILDFIRFVAPFTNSQISAKFEQELILLTHPNQTMGLREAILEDVLQQGIEQGIEKGIEQGIEKGIQQGIEKGIEQGIEQGIEKGIQQGIAKGAAQEKQALVQKLWTLQQFPVATIAEWVALPLAEVEAIVLEYLQAQGHTLAAAQQILAERQLQDPA